jgi:hypothetical protein
MGAGILYLRVPYSSDLGAGYIFFGKFSSGSLGYSIFFY